MWRTGQPVRRGWAAVQADDLMRDTTEWASTRIEVDGIVLQTQVRFVHSEGREGPGPATALTTDSVSRARCQRQSRHAGAMRLQ